MTSRRDASTSSMNTPLALHKADDQTGEFNQKEAKSRNSRNVQEAKKFVLGPMPVQSFLDDFLQDFAPDNRGKHMRSSSNAFKAVPVRSEKASDITGPLLKALNSATKYKSRCPNFMFENTARVKHSGRLSSMKPDICCFASRHLATVRSSSRRSRADLGYAALFIEVKPDSNQDFFCDPPPNADRKTRDNHQFILDIEDENIREQAERALGQHIFYATEVCARQHRAFCFSISMAGSRARLIRWDRAGAIVTESFDIREHPEPLCEFLWRFSQASDIERGYDTSVHSASQAEEILFREAITAHVKLQLEVGGDALEQAVREHYKPGVVAAIYVSITDDDGLHTRRFIVSRPMVSPLWLVGRGTRGYWAVDPENNHVVFLKDTWRYDGAEADREGNVLLGLNACGVRYVPTVICHGDVPLQAGNEAAKGYLAVYVLERSFRGDVVLSLPDDMESLLYVVLYCSLRWLPHNDAKSLPDTIRDIFNQTRYVRGHTFGGVGKHAELYTRTYTRDITWGTAPIQQWLETVLDYRSPRENPSPISFPETWSNPKHLDVFWTDFLISHVLESNDRIERDILVTAQQSISSTSSASLPSEISQPRSTRGPLTRSKARPAQRQAEPSKRTSGESTLAPVKGPSDEPKATQGRKRVPTRPSNGHGKRGKYH
ncbi:hypothetical protein A0H81_08662 [Grifola frondosa]|uniref:Fungal-type protein kinase domain-containing protein n=1 Tax=Grifola frondosa TaxID=5627 RepID=A0A1C7M4Z1_GRIFR|nr:hypothetical protein A0H81_08662 [Grifola frondosa]